MSKDSEKKKEDEEEEENKEKKSNKKINLANGICSNTDYDHVTPVIARMKNNSNRAAVTVAAGAQTHFVKHVILPAQHATPTTAQSSSDTAVAVQPMDESLVFFQMPLDPEDSVNEVVIPAPHKRGKRLFDKKEFRMASKSRRDQKVLFGCQARDMPVSAAMTSTDSLQLQCDARATLDTRNVQKSRIPTSAWFALKSDDSSPSAVAGGGKPQGKILQAKRMKEVIYSKQQQTKIQARNANANFDVKKKRGGTKKKDESAGEKRKRKDDEGEESDGLSAWEDEEAAAERAQHRDLGLSSNSDDDDDEQKESLLDKDDEGTATTDKEGLAKKQKKKEQASGSKTPTPPPQAAAAEAEKVDIEVRSLVCRILQQRKGTTVPLKTINSEVAKNHTQFSALKQQAKPQQKAWITWINAEIRKALGNKNAECEIVSEDGGVESVKIA